MSEFRIYNTLVRDKQIFKQIDPERISMYVCGITPYSDAHLGHARCYIVFDTFRRFLEYSGKKVFRVFKTDAS